MSRSTKKIASQSIIGQQGVNLAEARLLDLGFLWHPTGAFDAGIDGTIEIRDGVTGEVTNFILRAQIKATNSPFTRENDSSFEWLCEEADLDYWMNGNAPVILIVTRPKSSEAYWVPIKDYFRDPAVRAERRVRFDKARDRFDISAKQRLCEVALPEGGLFLAPPRKIETLYSNLLEVRRFPPRVYSALTDHRRPQSIWSELSRIGARAGSAWILTDRRVMSFHDLSEHPFDRVCERGTVEDFDTSEWSQSHDAAMRRDFVNLLNQALKEKLGPDIRYNRQLDCYYFRALPDPSRPRRIQYRGPKSNTSRVVANAYFSRDHALMYCRHSAFEGRFKEFSGRWFLEITPTYFYTSDGYQLFTWYEDRLKGIKRLERNQSFLGQLRMWEGHLGRAAGMFKGDMDALEFGQLQTFQVERGVDDRTWLEREDRDERVALDASDSQLEALSR